MLRSHIHTIEHERVNLRAARLAIWQAYVISLRLHSSAYASSSKLRLPAIRRAFASSSMLAHVSTQVKASKSGKCQ